MNKSALAVALSTAALLSACETNKARPDTDNGPNIPRPVATVAADAPAPAASAAAKEPPKPATLKWNDTGCADKNLTLTKAANAATGADGSCIKMTVSADPAKLPKGAKMPDAQIYTAMLNLPACTVTSTGIMQSGANAASGAWDLLKNGVLNRAGKAAGNAAGDGVAGSVVRKADDGVGARAGKAATTAGKDASAPISESAKACNAQIIDLSKGDFAKGVAELLKTFRESNKGLTPVVKFESNLTEANEASYRAAVTAANGGRAPK